MSDTGLQEQTGVGTPVAPLRWTKRSPSPPERKPIASQYLYFWIDDRGRILELRVTRRGDAGDARSSSRCGRSMTRDLSASYLRLEDLPPTYADPSRQHVRRTGEQQGVVEISAGEPGSESDDGPESGSEDVDSERRVESVRDEGRLR